MGAFNDWVRGTVLESADRRHAADVGRALMVNAAYLSRLFHLEAQGLRVSNALRAARPTEEPVLTTPAITS
jgi:hypothetical protein